MSQGWLRELHRLYVWPRSPILFLSEHVLTNSGSSLMEKVNMVTGSEVHVQIGIFRVHLLLLKWGVGMATEPALSRIYLLPLDKNYFALLGWFAGF